MSKTHEHRFELSHTAYQSTNPTSTSTAVQSTEYAYLLCQCGEVVKKKVNIQL